MWSGICWLNLSDLMVVDGNSYRNFTCEIMWSHGSSWATSFSQISMGFFLAELTMFCCQTELIAEVDQSGNYRLFLYPLAMTNILTITIFFLVNRLLKINHFQRLYNKLPEGNNNWLRPMTFLIRCQFLQVTSSQHKCRFSDTLQIEVSHGLSGNAIKCH